MKTWAIEGVRRPLTDAGVAAVISALRDTPPEADETGLPLTVGVATIDGTVYRVVEAISTGDLLRVVAALADIGFEVEPRSSGPHAVVMREK